jgi:hypothetical protein
MYMYSEVHTSVNCQEIVMNHTSLDNFVQNQPTPTAHSQDLIPRASFCAGHKWYFINIMYS